MSNVIVVDDLERLSKTQGELQNSYSRLQESYAQLQDLSTGREKACEALATELDKAGVRNQELASELDTARQTLVAARQDSRRADAPAVTTVRALQQQAPAVQPAGMQPPPVAVLHLDDSKEREGQEAHKMLMQRDGLEVPAAEEAREQAGQAVEEEADAEEEVEEEEADGKQLAG